MGLEYIFIFFATNSVLDTVSYYKDHIAPWASKWHLHFLMEKVMWEAFNTIKLSNLGYLEHMDLYILSQKKQWIYVRKFDHKLYATVIVYIYLEDKGYHKLLQKYIFVYLKAGW